MISILGPTAVGKSKTAIELAQIINGEIISADSMQVYRGMDIGTAKVPLNERAGIPHHLIDIRDPDEPWTVSDFIGQTNELTDEIEGRGKTPIIVGGTGLYLWTLFEGYNFPIASANKEIRERLAKEPLNALYDRLRSVDPAAASKIHPNDKKRVIRALEVYELTGKPISALQKRSFAGSEPILIGLNLPREELYKRIDARVDEMIAKGLIEEVQSLLAKGYGKELPSFQALGYKEVCAFLDHKWDREEMIMELKKRTRHFVRRQMTWFKRFKGAAWFTPPIDTRHILDYISKHGKDQKTGDQKAQEKKERETAPERSL